MIHLLLEHQMIDHINFKTDIIKGEIRGTAFVSTQRLTRVCITHPYNQSSIWNDSLNTF